MSQKIKLLFLTFLIYGIPIFLISNLPFSKEIFGIFKSPILYFLLNGKLLLTSPLGIIFDFLLVYCFYLLFFKKEQQLQEQKVYLIYSGLRKIAGFIFADKLKNEFTISKEEKTSLLFYLVKIIFVPVMINFAIGNIAAFLNLYSSIPVLFKTNSLALTQNSILNFYFPFIFYVILVVDTLIFAFGYLFESPLLKNVVKSVEPTVLGWLVAIICYPPFNNLTAIVLGWYSADFSDFGNININIVTGFLSLFFYVIYVWASIALGFKASNLTNRGIVSRGPYKYIRHPAYAAKNLSWWLMGIPFIKASGITAILSLSLWSFIYFLRAITEERHLRQDPDYVEYIKKVKYMFIPGLF